MNGYSITKYEFKSIGQLAIIEAPSLVSLRLEWLLLKILWLDAHSFLLLLFVVYFSFSLYLFQFKINSFLWKENDCFLNQSNWSNVRFHTSICCDGIKEIQIDFISLISIEEIFRFSTNRRKYINGIFSYYKRNKSLFSNWLHRRVTRQINSAQ